LPAQSLESCNFECPAPPFKDELTVTDSRLSRATGAGKAFTRVRWDWACGGPLLAAALIIGLINARNLDRLVRATAPRNPWEATQTMEAWRHLQGMPVYERGPDAHATHAYGALAPLVQGEIFRWVGPNNVSGRLLSLVSALLTVTLVTLTLTLRGQRSAWYFVVSWAMLLGVNFRSGSYFAENRPDMTALLFAAAGLLLIAHGQESGRGRFVVLGSLSLVAGFFFKQTAFIFAAVPPVALVLRGRRPSRTELVFAVVPLTVAVGVILGLRILDPTVYHYMIVVPKAFGLRWAATARNAWELLLDTPLFLVLLGEWVVFERASFHKDPRLLWLAAALAVTIPYCAMTSAKVGGTDNSLLPALLVVELIKTLPGTVVCPEDPTIVFYGTGRVGLNVYSECDAHPVGGTYPAEPPEQVLREIRAAEYLVDVYDDTQNFFKHDDLRALGFEPVAFADPTIESSDYRLWRRKRDRDDETLATRIVPSSQ
jgi:hypothetical protein